MYLYLSSEILLIVGTYGIEPSVNINNGSYTFTATFAPLKKRLVLTDLTNNNNIIRRPLTFK